jgi:Fe2+ or Zn2+ uptake regulation protein
MISKEYGKYTLICDMCGATTEEEYETFQDAVDAKRDTGWKSKKIDGEWVDLCPGCIEME